MYEHNAEWERRRQARLEEKREELYGQARTQITTPPALFFEKQMQWKREKEARIRSVHQENISQLDNMKQIRRSHSTPRSRLSAEEGARAFEALVASSLDGEQTEAGAQTSQKTGSHEAGFAERQMEWLSKKEQNLARTRKMEIERLRRRAPSTSLPAHIHDTISGTDLLQRQHTWEEKRRQKREAAVQALVLAHSSKKLDGT